MGSELISVIDAAAELGLVHKQTLFKIIKRLRLSTVKQRQYDRGNQLISYLTLNDFEVVKKHLGEAMPQRDENHCEQHIDRGVFYLIQLEPEHDPGRFKVGFASNLSERMRQHRCAAPLAKVLGAWACLPLWEKTAIDCVTQSSKQLHTEVFRTDDIAEVRKKCDEFFPIMLRVE